MPSPILRGTQRIVESDQDHGYCDCCVCQDTYEVETDAFGDGCMTYYLGFLAEALRHRQKGANP